MEDLRDKLSGIKGPSSGLKKRQMQSELKSVGKYMSLGSQASFFFMLYIFHFKWQISVFSML